MPPPVANNALTPEALDGPAPESVTSREAGNGHVSGAEEHSILGHDELLDALQAMKNGDFSVRTPNFPTAR
jgi:hypothetical protein